MVEKAEARARGVEDVWRGRFEDFSMPFESSCLHTTDIDSIGPLSSAGVAFLDLKFDDYGFSDWKWLLHHLNVLAVGKKNQNHSDASQYQM